MTDPLATVAAPCSHAVEIKKSRFLAQGAPVSSSETAMVFIDSLRDNGGSHHCWAWRIGQAYRFNDDSEPSSSAGKPILAAASRWRHRQVAVMPWYPLWYPRANRQQVPRYTIGSFRPCSFAQATASG